jgi:hypothetical protein
MAAGTSMSSAGGRDEIVELLAARLPRDRSAALVKHYREMMEELQKSHWESSTVKAGKFVEAVLKCLWQHVGNTVPDDKAFKVDTIITGLGQFPASAQHASIRLTIPRAVRFVYEVASNRGARHDSSELDPNVMDANGVTSSCSWILAELIRYSQKGKVSAPEAAELVAKLTEKKYPLFEEIDGRLYFANAKLGARKVGLLLLAYRYPGRIFYKELIAALIRHGETKANAGMAITRLKNVVDDDGAGNLRLRAPGLQEAESLLASNTNS